MRVLAAGKNIYVVLACAQCNGPTQSCPFGVSVSSSKWFSLHWQAVPIKDAMSGQPAWCNTQTAACHTCGKLVGRSYQRPGG